MLYHRIHSTLQITDPSRNDTIILNRSGLLFIKYRCHGLFNNTTLNPFIEYQTKPFANYNLSVSLSSTMNSHFFPNYVIILIVILRIICNIHTILEKIERPTEFSNIYVSKSLLTETTYSIPPIFFLYSALEIST